MDKLRYAGRGEFENWCLKNGYPNFDEWIDAEEEPYKRTVNCTFYLQHENGTYAMFTCTLDYDWGADNFNLEMDNLIREEVEVTQTVVQYRDNK